MKAEDLFVAAFSGTRDPRSTEYKEGCIAALERGCAGKITRQPYKLGTAQADAWFSGQDEGKRILRENGLPLTGAQLLSKAA